MKKIMCILLCAVLCIGIVFCVRSCKKDEGDPTVIDISTTAPEVEEKDPEDVVKIHLPIGLLDKKYQYNLDKYVKENGYISAKRDGMDYVIVKMRSLTHALLLTKVGMSIMKEMGAIVDSGDYPYAVRLGKYNEDFSQIVMLVKSEEYQKDPSSSVLPYMIAECGLYYQLYTTRKTQECEVIIADHETNKILYQHTYTAEDIKK